MSHSGLTCAAAAFLSGRRHGEVVFYQKLRFPEGAIGPVQFLWRAEEVASSDRIPEGDRDSQGDGEAKPPGGEVEENRARQLWLWAHPSCTAELIGELKAASEAENASAGNNGAEAPPHQSEWASLVGSVKLAAILQTAM